MKKAQDEAKLKKEKNEHAKPNKSPRAKKSWEFDSLNLTLLNMHLFPFHND